MLAMTATEPPPGTSRDRVEVEDSLRERVAEAVTGAWQSAIAGGSLPPLPDDERSEVDAHVERPAHPEHGDFATNLAMKLARPYRRSPMAIAQTLAAELEGQIGREAGRTQLADLITSVEVAPPGFLNFRLSERALEATIDRILSEPKSWGRRQAAIPQRVNVEFVSANPTGPLHIGNARGAFVGDLLARVLAAAGHEVSREYYFNDFGAQVSNLGASILALRDAKEVPEDGYRGSYVAELAADLPPRLVESAGTADDPAVVVGQWASERVRAGIEASLERLGVHFDVWKTEGSLHREGWVERAVAKLREAGYVYERDGATWFRSTDFGDDKDRVIYRSNGQPTYFAADIGYVTEKFSRGFDHLVYVWGADHHGTVARVRNAAKAMGYDRAAVEMLLIAWVRFVRDGREISMSKRSGEFITLDELLDEVGVDAARWFFASRGHTSGIDFDIELAKKQSNENPVYYVQYAHARIASILRKASETGLSAAGSIEGALSDEPEAGLARAVARLPDVVEDAAEAKETQGITAFATELATTFHAFYRDARVVDPDEPDRSRGRLALVAATQITLANALALLGISAPELM